MSAVVRRFFISLFVAGACGLGLAACSTSGNSFESSALRYIAPGQTTLDEASRLLESNPTNIYRQQDGSALAIWSYKNSIATDAVYFNQEVWLVFGPDGRFQHIVKSVNVPRANLFANGVRVDANAVTFPSQQ